jgi:hypothetical protein
MAVLLSSMFVFNQMGPIDEAAIDRLGLVTEVGGRASRAATRWAGRAHTCGSRERGGGARREQCVMSAAPRTGSACPRPRCCRRPLRPAPPDHQAHPGARN